MAKTMPEGRRLIPGENSMAPGWKCGGVYLPPGAGHGRAERPQIKSVDAGHWAAVWRGRGQGGSNHGAGAWGA